MEVSGWTKEGALPTPICFLSRGIIHCSRAQDSDVCSGLSPEEEALAAAVSCLPFLLQCRLPFEGEEMGGGQDTSTSSVTRAETGAVMHPLLAQYPG